MSATLVQAAVHESAHAVVAYRRGVGFAYAAVTPGNRDQGGQVYLDPVVDTISGHADYAVVTAAGPVADALTGADPSGSDGDLRSLDVLRGRYARLFPGMPFPNAVAAAKAELANPRVWSAVERLAATLCERLYLPGPEARGILAAALYVPRADPPPAVAAPARPTAIVRDRRWFTAAHEGAHVVVARLVGATVESVKLEPPGSAVNGVATIHGLTVGDAAGIKRTMLVLAAGKASADYFSHPDPLHTECGSDLAWVNRLHSELAWRDPAAYERFQPVQVVRGLLSASQTGWVAVKAVAAALWHRGSLAGDVATRLVDLSLAGTVTEQNALAYC